LTVLATRRSEQMQHRNSPRQPISEVIGATEVTKRRPDRLQHRQRLLGHWNKFEASYVPGWRTDDRVTNCGAD